MLLLTFSKTGQEDIVLTEDDLFDFDYEENAYSGETFELGGVCAKSIYMMIDNNTQRFSRGTFANTRIKLEIDGNFYGYFNAELPKRRNGVIELNAYDDMVKLDVSFPSDVLFPALFKQAYAYCTVAAGLAQEFSYDNVVLNGVWDNGIITYEYNDYIYANSCRNLVSGMAEWNGGFAHINSDGKLQVDKFSKTVSREYNSGDLFEFDYSDDTVIFTKVKTSQKNKTYEKGDDSGYTLVINNQYISYGLDDTAFETYLTLIYDYYNGFSLTPMSFALAEPDFRLHVGDRIQVSDDEEQVTITGNVSKIEIIGNCSMKVTCGGFENVSSSSNFTPTSFSQISQAKTEVVQTVGSSVGSTLTEYEYLTDLSAQCNGVTYTAEKDADTGLISKISDSNGNEFEPTINSGITDVTLHNAVFMAVAMIKGFESSTPIGAFAEFVPTGINLSELRWYNRIGEDYMKFSSKTPSTAMDSGDLVLKNWNQNLTYNCDDPATVYIIFKNTLSGYNLNTYGDQIPTFAPVLCRGGGIDIIYSFTTLICANDGLVCGLKKGGTPSNDVMLASTQSADSWHIGCLTRNDSNEISFYVDGSMVGTLCTYSTTQINEYTGYYAINARLSKNGILTNCYHENMYRYLAFCNVCHNSAQVLKYSGLLLNKYGK